jgi:raffinose/stachyose/melibiose transport system substrate-binding protein
LAGHDHPGLRGRAPRHPGRVHADRAGRVQRRAELQAAAGSAGDIITCRPFDASLELFNQGHLADLSDLSAMANFSDVAKSAWTTDDGSATFCVPMASVIHGFMYNKDAFEELGLEEPTTVDEFFAVLDAIKEDGTYIPWRWAATTSGKPRPWATRTSGPTTGAARKGAWR